MKKCEDGNSDKIFERIKPEWKELEDKATDLREEIKSIQLRLNTLPTEKEIETKRGMWAKLLLRTKQTYVSSGMAFEKLPFEEKKNSSICFLAVKTKWGKDTEYTFKSLAESPKDTNLKHTGN